MLARPLAPDQGFLLTRCSSVHTCFMRYALDVVYLNARGEITQTVPALRPWRFSVSRPRAAHTLELPAGTVERLGVRLGDRLEHSALAGRAQRSGA